MLMDNTANPLPSDHAMPQDALPEELQECAHRHLLGFYDGVYYWEFECQNCGATLKAMPDP
jgi:hypothetical protein